MPECDLSIKLTKKGIQHIFKDPETKETTIKVDEHVSKNAPRLTHNPFAALSL